MKLSPYGVTSLGNLISRGSDLGAGTTASPLSRPKASLPLRESIKFKLLLTSHQCWEQSRPWGGALESLREGIGRDGLGADGTGRGRRDIRSDGVGAVSFRSDVGRGGDGSDGSDWHVPKSISG